MTSISLIGHPVPTSITCVELCTACRCVQTSNASPAGGHPAGSGNERDQSSVCASLDKDLRPIPRRLFTPQKPYLGTITISERDANLFWMKQPLTGDGTDGFIGCRGGGPDKADKALMPVHEQFRGASVAEHLAALWAAVVKTYEAKKFTAADAPPHAPLARMLRHGDVHYKTNEILLWRPLSRCDSL